jgi:hypothetical protein
MGDGSFRGLLGVWPAALAQKWLCHSQFLVPTFMAMARGHHYFALFNRCHSLVAEIWQPKDEWNYEKAPAVRRQRISTFARAL